MLSFTLGDTAIVAIGLAIATSLIKMALVLSRLSACVEDLENRLNRHNMNNLTQRVISCEEQITYLNRDLENIRKPD